MPETRTRGPEVDQPLGMRWTPGRIAAVGFFVLIAVFWLGLAGIRVFGGSPAARNPDYLHDRAYAAELQARCEQLRDDLDELPPPRETPNAQERADVIEEANGIVATFVDDLAEGAPTTGDASISVGRWIEDWRTYLADREDYVDRLRQDADARFLVDVSELGGDSVDQTIAVFAEVNDIPECATPGDVG